MSYNELFEEIHLRDETAKPHKKAQINDLRQIMKFLKFDGEICVQSF